LKGLEAPRNKKPPVCTEGSLNERKKNYFFFLATFLTAFFATFLTAFLAFLTAMVFSFPTFGSVERFLRTHKAYFFFAVFLTAFFAGAFLVTFFVHFLDEQQAMIFLLS
jgi:hypothetical protein